LLNALAWSEPKRLRHSIIFGDRYILSGSLGGSNR